MKYIQAFRISDGSSAWGPVLRPPKQAGAEALQQYKSLAEKVAGESCAMYVADESEAPEGKNRLVATIEGGEVVGTPSAPAPKTVTISLAVDGSTVPGGWAKLSKTGGAVATLTVATDTTASGAYALPVRRPDGAVWPLDLSFTDGNASLNLDPANLEAGKYQMLADDVLGFLQEQVPSLGWKVQGRAVLVIVA